MTRSTSWTDPDHGMVRHDVIGVLSEQLDLLLPQRRRRHSADGGIEAVGLRAYLAREAEKGGGSGERVDAGRSVLASPPCAPERTDSNDNNGASTHLSDKATSRPIETGDAPLDGTSVTVPTRLANPTTNTSGLVAASSEALGSVMVSAGAAGISRVCLRSGPRAPPVRAGLNPARPQAREALPSPLQSPTRSVRGPGPAKRR
jgi:hypothetical protein